MDKAESAFRTIGELSDELGVPQHILRYWETRFPQLRPLQRAGNRRYYRPADVALARRIHQLLDQDGYTIKGVQKLLARRGKAVPDEADAPDDAPEPMIAAEPPPVAAAPQALPAGLPLFADPPAFPDLALLAELRAIRDTLAAALAADRT